MALTPTQLSTIRERILADPYYLASVIGIQIEWIHRRWFEFSNRQPKHVLEAPRGFGKSTVCTTLLVIWRILRDPEIRVLIVSKTEDMASRMCQEIRGYLEGNEILKKCFGAFVGTGKWTDTRMIVAQRTRVHKEATITAMGIGGPITSGHWDLEIVDDPFDEESARSPADRDHAFSWLFATLRPTLNPGGQVGFRCTRYHYDDLAGRIERELAFDKQTGELLVYRIESPDDVAPIDVDARWKVLQTPAILRDGTSLWEERFPIEDRVDPDGSVTEGLRRMRAEAGERQFGEQYLMVCEQLVAGQEEQFFRREWIKPWGAAPKRERLQVYEFVDPAFRSAEEAARRTKRDREPDFYAIGVVGFDRASGRVYVLDAYRDRLTPLERETKAKEYADRWKPTLVEVERTGLQIREAPDFYARILEALRPHRARFGRPRVDKTARAHPFARACETGLVEWSPEILERTPGIVDEFARFPFDRHDDFVDAICGAYLMGERRPRSLAAHARQVRGGGISEASLAARSGVGVAALGASSARGGGGSAQSWSARMGL